MASSALLFLLLVSLLCIPSSNASLSTRTVATQLALAALRQRNSTGALPSVERLNALLIQANGATALQLPSADADAQEEGISLDEALRSVLESSSSGRAPFTPPSFSAPVPPPILSPGSPPVPPSLAPLLSLLGAAPPSSVTPGSDVRSAAPVSREMDAALRAVRFGVYDALYGYLEAIGYQLISIGSWLQVSGVEELLEAEFILFATGNQLLSIGYLMGGMKGAEEVEVAEQALAELREAEAKQAAAGNVTGAATETPAVSPSPSGLSPDSPRETGRQIVRFSNPLRSLLLRDNPDLPFQSFRTMNAAGSEVESAGESEQRSDAASSSRANVTRLAPLVCPSFLFAHWQWLDTGAAEQTAAKEGDGSSTRTHNTAESPGGHSGRLLSVLLRFGPSAYERIETSLTSAGKQRVSARRWEGPLQVDCEWPLATSEEGAELGAAHASASAWSWEKNASTQSSHPARSRLLDSLRAALSVPAHHAAEVTVRVPVCSSSDSLSLHFTLLQLHVDGVAHATLVERIDTDGRDGSVEHARAFLRIAD